MPRNGRLFILSLIILFILPSLSFAEDAVIITDERSAYSFPGHLRIVREPSGAKDVSAMLPLLRKAAPEAQAEPNFGYTADSIWVHTTLANHSRQTDYFLYLNYNVDFVTLYFNEREASGPPQVNESGGLVQYSRRPYSHRLPVFPLRLEQGKTYELILTIRSSGTAGVPLVLYTPAAFAAYNDAINLFFGIMFGILFGLILYILFLIISTRTTNYIFFILFAVFHLIFQLTINGLTGLYLAPEHPLAAKVTFIFSGAITLIMGILFAQVFLQTRKHTPVFHVILFGMAGLTLLAFPFTGVGWFLPSIMLENTFIFLSALIISINAIKVYFSGNKTARFYILAYISLIVSALIFTLKNFGILPSNFFTTQSVLFGSVIESVLLSLAIADRINSLRDENQGMQVELLQSRENEIKTLKEKFYQDSMTGLDNRNRLIMDMQKEAACSLFIINIDNFRQVNNLYGTIIGNKILYEVARRLKTNGLPGPHAVYRLHADEFALVLPRELPDLELVRIADQLHVICQERPYIIDLFVIPLSVTIGAASGSDNILGRADMALSYARETGKEFLPYSADFDMRHLIKSNLECIQLLRQSIDLDSVFPVFQPIMNNASNAVDKFETLMRIRDLHTGRILGPAEFLSVAKRSRLYPQLSRLLIRKGIECFRQLPYEFSLNISVNDILDKESTAAIWENVERHPDTSRIVFEILESESIEAYDPVSKFIQEARQRGCKIAIDDFGSGYSNFEHILRLNVDYLKIDATLIRDMHTDRNARMVVETIAQFARRLKVKTVAEFVHCEEVFNLVRYLGINFSQGAYIGMPQPEPVARPA